MSLITRSESHRMSTAIPWSVKGVEPEAREAAKLAARRRGIPVGQWLTQTILSSAAQELKHSNRHSDAAVAGEDDNGTDPNAPDLVSRSQELHRQKFKTSGEPVNGRSGPPALTPEAIMASIQKLASRVEETENRTAEAIAPLAERIAGLDSQIGDIKSRGVVSTAPVERAMMRLNERLEKLEGTRNPDAERGLLGKLFGRG